VSLSDRDERIARLLARGHTRRDIAERVGCSERTVYTVLQNPDVMELAAQVREEQGGSGALIREHPRVANRAVRGLD
jgi:transposase